MAIGLSDLEISKKILCFSGLFVYYVITVLALKLGLLSANAQIRSNSSFFQPLWPWNLTDDIVNIRGPVPCSWKLCVLFHTHPWIWIKVIVLIRWHCSQIVNLLPVWLWNLMDGLKKLQGAFSMSPVNSNWGYRPETIISERIRWFVGRLLWPWYLTDDLEIQ